MKKVKALTLAAIVLGGLTALGNALAEDDFQYWSRYQIKLLDTQYFDFTHYNEFRLNDDASNLGLWLTSQKLELQPWKYLGFGLNYTYLETETANARRTQNEYKYHHRLELEATPNYDWRGRIKFKNRNRIEFRWIEDKGSDHGRFRHLWEVEIPVKKIPRVQAVYLNNEFFIDFNTREINENRVVPFGVTFHLYRKIALKTFYMIQSKKADTWESNQIFGTNLLIAF